eukprot:31307-Pelagococcus_subviridis.AAC.10
MRSFTHRTAPPQSPSLLSRHAHAPCVSVTRQSLSASTFPTNVVFAVDGAALSNVFGLVSTTTSTPSVSAVVADVITSSSNVAGEKPITSPSPSAFSSRSIAGRFNGALKIPHRARHLLGSGVLQRELPEPDDRAERLSQLERQGVVERELIRHALLHASSDVLLREIQDAAAADEVERGERKLRAAVARGEPQVRLVVVDESRAAREKHERENAPRADVNKHEDADPAAVASDAVERAALCGAEQNPYHLRQNPRERAAAEDDEDARDRRRHPRRDDPAAPAREHEDGAPREVTRRRRRVRRRRRARLRLGRAAAVGSGAVTALLTALEGALGDRRQRR